MLSKSDEGILDDRLRNWGRWAADRRPGGSSVLWRMMKRYRKPDKNDSPPEKEERNRARHRRFFEVIVYV